MVQRNPVIFASFTALFADVRAVCRNSPEKLQLIAANSLDFKKKCTDLMTLDMLLSEDQRRSANSFWEMVPPTFVASWREFENSYRDKIKSIFLAQLPVTIALKEEKRTKVDSFDDSWIEEDALALLQSSAIDEAVDFALLNADQDWRWDEDQYNFIEKVRNGVIAWSVFKNETGFDPHGALRRRALVSFTLFSRRLSPEIGSIHEISIIKNLKEAHISFIFGAHFASLVMLRSILEITLRDFYGAHEILLSRKINEVKKRLPPGVSAERLHKIRSFANAILHLDTDKNELEIIDLERMSSVRIEKECLSFFSTITKLIEGIRPT